MRVLLLRPPRYVWPFNSETSAFWQPLGLLCLAAAVRRALPDVQIEVWDAPGRRCGWRTLERKLAAQRVDVVGVGEETVSAHEALRAAGIVKGLHPGCVVVAGGTYFGHAIPETLADGRVDVIVRGEGEQTFVELLRHVDQPRAWGRIPGIAVRTPDGRVLVTPAQKLTEDLDSLPQPAYDLLDMNDYGRGSRNHPGLVSIEHSRGCIDSCAFCILWKQMGESVNGNGDVRPRWRTKSAARSFDEVSWLYERFGRRTFGWVDPTFNVSPQWSDAWAERMLGSPLVSRRGPRTVHTAWLRADGVVRDEQLGVLDKLVRAGLRQVMIGLERDDHAGLAALGKHQNDPELCRQAVAIFRERYPQVYTIGTMVFGLPQDTAADLDRLVRWQDRIGIDYCFFIPLTPNPGTAAADDAVRCGRVAGRPLADYNFHTPVCTTDTLGLRELERIYWRATVRPSRQRLSWAVRELLLQRDARKRRVSWALFRHGTTIALESLWRTVRRPKRSACTSFSRRPSWYDT
jgi:anaerobic magnesium-protoporphyrin IX monomethyl ester cyclase